MTNSTDNQQEEKTDKSEKKKNKKKGPIRFEAVVPVVVIGLLLFGYFYLFFDSNLRSAIELGATYGHGAEVNVGDLNSSFLDGKMVIRDIQVTDKGAPERNLFQIGEIRFNLSWDALLRAKIVIEEASVLNIQALSPRKRPGRIIPKEETATENKMVQEVEEKALDELKESYNKNILGDVANVLGGEDPSKQIDKMTADLKSEKRIKEIEAELKKKEKEWKERFAKLPQKKEVDALIARAKAIKLEGNPLQVAQGLKEVDSVLKEADRIQKTYSKAHNDLNGDYKKIEGDVGNIDKIIEKDIADLQKRLKIPSLNVADFSKGLFGRLFLDKLGSYAKYANMAKEYMPPPKDERTPEEKIQVHVREKGRDIPFKVTTGYPLFWLKKAKISSQPTDSQYSGKIEGLLQNATSDPKFLGKPFTAHITGDFPHQKVMGLNMLVTLDHTKIPAKETLQMKIASFPVSRMALSESSDVTYAFDEAQGSSVISGTLIENKINMKMNNKYSNIKYDIKASSKDLKDVLLAVAKDIPVVTLNATAKGPWGSPNIGINSNLGNALSRGFKKQLDAKIQEARRKLKAFVDNKIKGERAKLDKQVAGVKKQFDAEVGKHKKEIDRAKSQINAEKKKAKSGTQKKLDDLKKKIKLPW